MLNFWSYLQFDRFDEAKKTIKVPFITEVLV